MSIFVWLFGSAGYSPALVRFFATQWLYGKQQYKGTATKSHLCIPRKGIARPQSQFPHSCVCWIFPGSIHTFSCSRIILPTMDIKMFRKSLIMLCFCFKFLWPWILRTLPLNINVALYWNAIFYYQSLSVIIFVNINTCVTYVTYVIC